MIEADIGKAFDALSTRLRLRAQSIAQARARQHRLADAPDRWRRAGWLWPTFGQG